jgi:hypothetical protein
LTGHGRSRRIAVEADSQLVLNRASAALGVSPLDIGAGLRLRARVNKGKGEPERGVRTESSDWPRRFSGVVGQPAVTPKVPFMIVGCAEQA